MVGWVLVIATAPTLGCQSKLIRGLWVILNVWSKRKDTSDLLGDASCQLKVAHSFSTRSHYIPPGDVMSLDLGLQGQPE